MEKRLIPYIAKNCSPSPPRNPFRLFAPLLLAAVLLGACDSYNLSFEEFFNGPPTVSGSPADDGGSGNGGSNDDGRTGDNGNNDEGENGDGGEARSSAKAVTAFTITSPVSATGLIDEEAKTIAVTVPYGTGLNGLTPAITHTGASISPASGTAQDFTGPVDYTVTAEDNSTAVYTVTVTAASSSAKAITAFSIGGVAGTIDEGAKTITLTAPSGTVLNNLIPAITHTGASMSPESGTAQDFTGTVEYIVTAADNSTVIYTVTVIIGELNSVEDFAAYLEAAANGSGPTDPVILPPLELNLAGNWTNLLATIQAKGKHVSLDLSACTGSATFSPGAANTGKDKIVSLVLPDTATSIADGTEGAPTFQHFSALKSVNGENIETIGSNAFRNCPALTTVDFPAAAVIDSSTFRNCSSLTTVNIPNATTINIFAFQDCVALTTVDFPKATTIYGDAFHGCTALTTANLPLTETIGPHTFNGCTVLTLVNLPKATTIDYEAFRGCTSLTTLDLPLAETIGSHTFNGCTTLTLVNLPKATAIDYCAFAITGTENLTVTLGSTPPSLGEGIFAGLSSAKSVTVKAPSTALSAYGSAPVDTTSNNWGNAFRGKGWNGTNYLAGSVNSNINLAFDTY